MKLLKKIFKGKIKANDTVRKYSTTPGINGGWDDAVLEARGYGIPIAAFGDTKDKIVLHPRHLGYKDFNYYWGDGHWSDSSCWNYKNKSNPKSAKIQLLKIAKLLSKKFKVRVLNPSGSGHGYLSGRLYNLDFFIEHYENDDEFDQIVLFVYNIKVDDLTDELITELVAKDESVTKDVVETKDQVINESENNL